MIGIKNCQMLGVSVQIDNNYTEMIIGCHSIKSVKLDRFNCICASRRHKTGFKKAFLLFQSETTIYMACILSIKYDLKAL